MMLRNTSYLAVLLLLLFMASCTASEEEQGGDKLLARVQNKQLYLSQMRGMLPAGISSEDSSFIIKGFVERWTHDAVLLNEAEANLPANLDVDKLVRDYRASLIRANYERVLVEEKLDSVITQEELQAYYDKNKELYELETSIVRCHFIKISVDAPNSEMLRGWWNSNTPADTAQLRLYCQEHSDIMLLDDKSWYSVDDVASQMPEGTLTPENISAKKEFTQRDEYYQYYFRLLELRNQKEIAPLSYIEKQARKVILHKRKLVLVENFKKQIYDREMQENNIETFID